jgi:predicted cupin superfamily sugar epimerase
LKLLAAYIITSHPELACPPPPGFEFANFEMGEKERLLRDFPRAADWIERLMAD